MAQLPIPSKSVGYMAAYLGPMNGAKTQLATNAATHYADTGESVIFINSAKDQRITAGGSVGKFSSHSSSNIYLSEKVTTATVKLLKDVDISQYRVIIIDESQFYEDLFDTVTHWVDNLNKHIIITGLDGSFSRSSIGQTLRLLPNCDHYEKLTAKCKYCIQELHNSKSEFVVNACAPFTAILSDKALLNVSNEILPGGMDMYISVCRRHHKELNDK